MLINLDAKQLEWVAAVYLSGDTVGRQEILDGADAHAENQVRFKLPTRLIAKTFLFRLIFGGSAYAYAHDPDFTHHSSSEKYWQSIIDGTYDKYKGLNQWHTDLIQEVSRSGHLKVVTGRQYKFFRENNELPRSKILNYPVQGLGHDLMALIRVALWRRTNQMNLKSLFVSTVHDSVLLDTPTEIVPSVCKLIFQVFKDVPKNFERLFKVPFDLPLNVEVQVGPNWGQMVDLKEKDLAMLGQLKGTD